jgi:CHAT domain-containing protein
LSGLVMAGANVADGDRREGDGILTAEEVVGMNLAGLELVTLSACDTGRGEVYWGQGVMGLRRAFSLAGARAMVMSLWKVPDVETRLLMEDFYRQVLRSPKISKASAMRQAQLSMIASQRKQNGQTDPRTWAAFIVSGR